MGAGKGDLQITRNFSSLHEDYYGDNRSRTVLLPLKHPSQNLRKVNLRESPWGDVILSRKPWQAPQGEIKNLTRKMSTETSVPADPGRYIDKKGIFKEHKLLLSEA